MALFKLADRFPNYRDRFLDGNDVKGMTVYADDEEKVGRIHDVLVDETGRLRYFVVDTGFWVFGKKVLLPIGRCTDGPDGDRIYANGLTKEQVEALPEYSDELVVDQGYEEQVRQVYRGPSVEQSAAVETSTAVEQPGVKGYAVTAAPTPTPPAPNKIGVPPQDKRVRTAENPFPAEVLSDYDRDPDLYGMSDERHRRLRLYEERLVAEKHREKTGDVTVTKRIETKSVEGSVPVQTEKIVIEIESTVGATRVNLPEGELNTGSVAHTDLHGDQVNVCKEVVPRQEITIRKETEEEVVNLKGQVRREHLEVQRQGDSEVEVVDKSS